MQIQLSDHFHYGKLLRFTLPSIIMMIFASVYSVVDGFFVSNFVGTSSFAAVNLIMPFTQIIACVGYMFGTGGSALVSLKLGEGRKEEANRIFSMLIYTGFSVGLAFAVFGFSFMREISLLLGASGEMLPHCMLYGRILCVALPVYVLQHMFQSFLVTDEKPGLGLAVTVTAGVANIVLDAVFILVCRWGLAGAAIATVIAQCIGGIGPLIYFFVKRDGVIALGKTKFYGKALINTCTNGMSEFVTNMSMSVVAVLYNWQLMRFVGENGVAAFGAVMYVGFFYVAVFLGYSMGIAPVVSYHYGAGNTGELKSLLRKSSVFILISSVLLAALAFLFAVPLALLFNHSNMELLAMTETAFRYYAVSVLFSGVGIFGSAFFTALNDGFVSAVISFLRTLVFQIASVLILPVFFGINGVWYSLFIAEILAAFVTAYFFVSRRGKYRYL